MDRETEQFVNNTLTMISQNKTVITVAHRLAAITDYDNILMLDEGQIVEMGTHETLLKMDMDYFEKHHSAEAL